MRSITIGATCSVSAPGAQEIALDFLTVRTNIGCQNDPSTVRARVNYSFTSTSTARRNAIQKPNSPMSVSIGCIPGQDASVYFNSQRDVLKAKFEYCAYCFGKGKSNR